MKETNKMKYLLRVALAFALLPALGLNGMAFPQNEVSVPESATTSDESLDSIDTAPPKHVKMELLARAYGDSIVLRWAVDRFPEWLYLSETGVNVLRLDHASTSLKFDTVALGVKPLPLAEMYKRFPESDSTALLAMGSLYGTGSLTAEMTPWTPGSMGAFVDIEQDQKMRLAVAFLAAEWRPDLADALGLRIVDRNVKKGHVYDYVIRPTVPDTAKFFLIDAGSIRGLKNEKFRPQPYDVTLTDSITGHGKTTLRWNDDQNGTFEIYRRPKGAKEWTHVNARPYLPPYKFGFDNEDAIYAATVDSLGTYEFAVQAHDAFGDLTEMSKPLTVSFPDLMPPLPPIITQIFIERPNLEDPAAEVWANIHFSKDTIENDFVRYVPMYYNERDSLKTWRLLTNQYVAPDDTVIRVDVTHVSTGMITIAAVDTAENMGYAMPTLLRVADLKPPVAPTNLVAIPKITGEILLTWNMPDSLDVQHYEVFYANDRSHHFVSAVDNEMVISRAWQDTVAINANQRYIYYTVRARDYARNIGPFSDTIQVLRPNPYPPTEAHLDSTYTTNDKVYMRWAVGGEEYIAKHFLKRKMESEPEDRWTTIAVLDGDSVAAAGHLFEYTDHPAINRKDRYEYCVETISLWDVKSKPSASLLTRIRGENVVSGIELKAYAVYDERNGEIRLAWEHGQLPVSAPYFYCIYRKTAAADFSFITNAQSSERLFTDRHILPGETNQYYITLRFKDGRGTMPSNVVSVTAPKKQNSDSNSSTSKVSENNK